MSADLHHMAAAYALDAVDDIERREFEIHYPSCEICTTEVEEFLAVAASLAMSTATPAPATLKSSVLSEISQTRQLSPLSTTKSAKAPRFSSRVLLAAAAALIVLAGVVAVTLPSSTDDQVTEIVTAGDAVQAPLEALADDQAGEITVTWSQDLDKVVIEGSDLPDPGDGNAYALWYILDSGVLTAGRFSPQDGSVDAVLDAGGKIAGGWGVTIEPAEGQLVTPTGDILFGNA